MLPASRIEIKCRRIRHVASGVIGDDRNVVAYLVLHWIAFEGIERIAYRDIGRPRHAAVGAPGIE